MSWTLNDTPFCYFGGLVVVRRKLYKLTQCALQAFLAHYQLPPTRSNIDSDYASLMV